MNVRVCCPYCSVKNNVKVDPLDTGPTIILCDIDEGGCDRYFAAKIVVRRVVEAIYRLVDTHDATTRNNQGN